MSLISSFLRAGPVRYVCAGVLVVGITVALMLFGDRSPDPSSQEIPEVTETYDSGSNGLQVPMFTNQTAISGDSKDSITPDEAKTLLADAKSLANAMERSARCIKVIERLCLAGYVDEAWAMIDENPGQVRSSELAKFFKCAGLSSLQLAEKVGNLPYKGEAASALRGYFSSLNSEQTAGLLQESTFKALISKLDDATPGILKKTLAATLMGRVAFPGEPADKKQAVEEAINYHSRGIIDDEGFAQVLKRDTSKDSFEKWSLVADAAVAPHPRSQAGELRKEIIEGMIGSDAPKALAQIALVPEEKGTGDLQIAIKKWGIVDSVAANSWFQANKTQLSDKQRDGAAVAFFQLALDFQETDGAKAWASQIADPVLRELALKKLP